MELLDNGQGNYRFVKGIRPYSCGVIADPGYEVIHIKFKNPMPLFGDVLDRINNYLNDKQRPVQALCAMELRIPAPLSFDGFKALNERYRTLISNYDLLLGDLNPLARTNISLRNFAFSEPMIYAFSYTMPQLSENSQASFIVAGAGDLQDQTDLSPESIIRPNDQSIEGLREKAAVVLNEMQHRLDHLRASWEQVTCVNIYTMRNIQPLLDGNTFEMIGAANMQGLHWYYSLPPITGLEFEMDIRGVHKEFVISI